MRPLSLIALCAAIAGCQSGNYGVPGLLAPEVSRLESGILITLSAEQADAVKAGIRASLKDPDSARFDSPFQAVRNSAGNISVCGYVNGKNSYGGYTGTQPFLGSFSGNNFMVATIGSRDTEILAVRQVCQKLGVSL